MLPPQDYVNLLKLHRACEQLGKDSYYPQWSLDLMLSEAA